MRNADSIRPGINPSYKLLNALWQIPRRLNHCWCPDEFHTAILTRITDNPLGAKAKKCASQ